MEEDGGGAFRKSEFLEWKIFEWAISRISGQSVIEGDLFSQGWVWLSQSLSLVHVEAWADSGRVCLWTLDQEFLSIFRNGILYFPGDDFHIYRKDVTPTVNEALWEAAVHTNELQIELLHR